MSQLPGLALNTVIAPTGATGAGSDLADLFSYMHNVKANNGCDFTGTNDAGGCLSGASSAAGANTQLNLEPGALRLTTAVSQSANRILWESPGNTTPNGTPLLTFNDSNVFEGIVNGARYLNLSIPSLLTPPAPNGALRVDFNYAGFWNSTAKPGGVLAAIKTNCDVPAPAAAGNYNNHYIWCTNITLTADDASPSGYRAQNVALAANVIRDVPVNGGGTSSIWAELLQVNDESGLPAISTGPSKPLELDTYANDDDIGANGNVYGIRRDLQFVIGKYSQGSGVAARVGAGASFGSNDESFFGVEALFTGMAEFGALDTTNLTGLSYTNTTDAVQNTASLNIVTFAACDNSLRADGVMTLTSATNGQIPSGDLITAVTPASLPGVVPVTDCRVTLATATPAAIPAGTSLTGSVPNVALNMTNNQRINLDQNGHYIQENMPGGAAFQLFGPNGVNFEVYDGSAQSLLYAGTGGFSIRKRATGGLDFIPGANSIGADTQGTDSPLDFVSVPYFTQTSPPTIACTGGTCAMDALATDISGQVMVTGAVTQATITYSQSHSQKAFCTVNASNTSGSLSANGGGFTASGFTAQTQFTSAGGYFTYVCL